VDIKSISISKKIQIPLIASIVIGFLIILVNYLYSIEELTDDVYTKEKNSLKTTYSELMVAKRDIGLTNAINIANDYSVVRALLEDNRAIAIEGLKTLSQKFKKYTRYKNIKVHIHDANLHSFLRAWKPDKYGDDLRSFRNTIVAVKRDKKPLVAVELGRAGLVLRGLAPVLDKGTYLGSVEFMQGLNSIVKSARKSNGYEIVIVMKNEFLPIATRLQNAPRIGAYTLAVKKDVINPDFLHDLKNIKIDKVDNFQITERYFIVSEPIEDFSGKVIAYALVGDKIENVNSVIS